MDTLAAMLRLAEEEGIFGALVQRMTRLHASMYANDVVIFLKPEEGELRAIKTLLNIFAIPSGLHPNFSKISISLIQCDAIDLAALSFLIDCPVAHFPCTYLGMPHKLHAVEARRLPGHL